jgi:enediyne biosynthesis thioesterase
MRSYEYRHIVSFDETNLVGNVYYVNHIRWQGLCREMFLRDHAPGVLRELNNGLSLVTVYCSCSYLAEIFAFDEIVIRMRLADLSQNRITMAFEYIRSGPLGAEVVARGEQQIVSMRREGNQSVTAPIPAALREALRQYAEGG